MRACQTRLFLKVSTGATHVVIGKLTCLPCNALTSMKENNINFPCSRSITQFYEDS